MKQKNRLYTVNKWNRPMFMGDRSHQNIFDGFLSSRLNPQQMSQLKAYNLSAMQSTPSTSGVGLGTLGNIGGAGNIVETDPTKFFGLGTGNDAASKGGSWLGLSKEANPFSKQNLAGIGKAAGSAAITAGAGLLGSMGANAISGGLQSDAGAAIGTVGSSVAGAVGTVNPIAGAVVGVGSQLLGGLANRAFGSKMNQENIQKVENDIASINSSAQAVGSANNNEDLLSSWSSANMGADFSKGDIGEDGWFSSKASDKYKELKKKQNQARQNLIASMVTGAENADQNQDALVMQNFAAFGGLLTMKRRKKFEEGGDTSAPATPKPYYELDVKNDIRDFYTKDFTDRWVKNHPNNTQEQIAKLFDDSKVFYENLRPGVTGSYDTKEKWINLGHDLPNNEKRSTLAHEERHLMDYQLGQPTNEEWQILHDAYNLSAPDKYTDIQREYPTTNTELRYKISEANNKALGEDLNNIIRNMDDFEILRQASRINGYSDGYYEISPEWFHKWFKGSEKKKAKLDEQRKKKADAIRKALIEVADNNNYGMENVAAFGGELGTNGTDFTNGLLYINEGGSHESNPLDGVPMGFDAEGIPNLVEEGETVYNDYVFSDRMRVPAFMLQDLGLPKGKKDISFADASKKLAQESEKRPNDPISKAGLHASLSRLAEIQETERMRKQTKEYMGLSSYACGGKMGRKYGGPGSQTNKLKPYKYDPIDTFKYWNKDANSYDKGYRDFIQNKVNDDWINRVMAGNYGDMSRYKGANNFNPSVEQAQQLGLDEMNSDWHKAMAAAYDEYKAGVDPKTGQIKTEIPSMVDTAKGMGLDVTPQDTDLPKQELVLTAPKTSIPIVEEEEYEGLEDPKTYATWMRYAPAVGAGIMTLTDALGLTNKPDYGMANKLERYATEAGVSPSISYKPVGDYLRYNPMDIWVEQNRMNANSRATDRAIANSSSPSKAAALLANGYNSQLASGNLYRQALEYNDAKRKDITDFNRRTNMFNSQMGLKAAMANAKYTQAARQMGLSGLAQAAALRDSIDARVGATKSANLSNFLTSLGNIGRENFAMNQLNWDKSRSYSTDASGRSSYKRKKK